MIEGLVGVLILSFLSLIFAIIRVNYLIIIISQIVILCIVIYLLVRVRVKIAKAEKEKLKIKIEELETKIGSLAKKEDH